MTMTILLMLILAVVVLHLVLEMVAAYLYVTRMWHWRIGIGRDYASRPYRFEVVKWDSPPEALGIHNGFVLFQFRFRRIRSDRFEVIPWFDWKKSESV